MSDQQLDSSAYDEHIDKIVANLDLWRGAKTAASKFLGCKQSQLSRWLNSRPDAKDRVIMSGVVLSKLLEFIEFPEERQRLYLQTMEEAA